MKMKNFMVVACFLSISFIACSNNIASKDVPSVVLNAFKSQFPTALDVEWEKVNNLHEADFELENIDHTAQLSIEGKLLQLKKELTSAELPKLIAAAIAANYGDYKLDDVELVTKGNTSFYQAQLEKDWKRDKKIVFQANGQEDKSLKYWD